MEKTYRFVDSETDLAKAKPGEFVKVKLDSREEPRWMVFGGMSTPVIKPDTVCAFIGRNPGDGSLGVWESRIRYLQFPGEYVHFDYLHRNYSALPPEATDTGLVDLLKQKTLNGFE